MTSVTIRTQRTYLNFLIISSGALTAFAAVEAELGKVIDDDARFLDLRVRRFNQYSVAIVFAGMCIEAFLYDYAAQCFGDDFVRAHLDNLGFLSKCEAYPRLVLRSKIRSGSHLYKIQIS